MCTVNRDEWADRAAKELPARFYPDALALIDLFASGSDWPRYGRLTWMDGTGHSKAVGPAVLFPCLTTAYAATVLAEAKNLKTRWLRDCTGHLVVPACVLPHPDGE